MKKNPKVTVLMAARNAGRYLQISVDSILQQSYKDFEFLIIDDASDDGSVQGLHVVGDDRLRILANEKNIGLTRSLNLGLKEARGEYIARIDADDCSHPDRLLKQTDFLEKNPGYLLVGSSYRTIDSDGEVISTTIKPMDDIELRWVSQTRTAIEHSSAVFRRLGQDGEPFLYNEAYRTAQDYDLWLRIMAQGKACVLGDVLLDYRVHDGSITNTQSSDQLAAIEGIALTNAIDSYGLGTEDTRLVRSFLHTYITKDSCDRETLMQALRGLAVLQVEFIKKQLLTGEDAMRIRAKAAGQFWAMTRSPNLKPGLIDAFVVAVHGWWTLYPLLHRTVQKVCR